MEPRPLPTTPPNEPESAAPPNRRAQASRTETGLLLLALAILVQQVPVVSVLGLLLGTIGAILLILGAPAFGGRHETLVWVSVFLFVGAQVAMFALAGSLASSINAQAGASGSAAANAVLGAFDSILIGGVVAASVTGVAYALIAFSLEDRAGQILLVAGVVVTIAVSIAVVTFILDPLVHAAITQAYASTPPNVQVIENADAQLRSLTAPLALDAIPLLLFAGAYVWAMHRIGRGVIPPPAPPSARTSNGLLAGIVAVIVLLSAVAVGGAVTGTFSATPAPPPTWTTVATFTGNSTGRTANFTITGTRSMLNESIFGYASVQFDFSVYTAGSDTLMGTCGMGGGGGGPSAMARQHRSRKGRYRGGAYRGLGACALDGSSSSHSSPDRQAVESRRSRRYRRQGDQTAQLSAFRALGRAG